MHEGNSAPVLMEGTTMDTKQRTNLLSAADTFRLRLAESDLKGPKTNQIITFLAELQAKLRGKATDNKPDLRAQVTDMATRIIAQVQSQPRKPRTPATPATGLFKKRDAQMKLGLAVIPVTSITQAEQKAFAYVQAHPTITTAQVALAIQLAYPTNNYGEQRVISAFKKFQREQNQPAEEVSE